MHDPVGRIGVTQEQVHDLRQYPGRDQVGRADAKDVSSFQFFKKTHSVNTLPKEHKRELREKNSRQTYFC